MTVKRTPNLFGEITMPTIRSFIALEIDPQTKKSLSELISILKTSDTDIKWAAENQMHFTLKFLGDTEQNKIPAISESLKSIAVNFNAFTIKFSHIGGFPNINHPRVIWIGIDKGSEALKGLAGKVESEMEKLGFPKEKRDYKAHLTLGRVRSLKNIPALTKLITETIFQLQNEVKIDKLILFQSTLTPKGAIYTLLTRVHLVGVLL